MSAYFIAMNESIHGHFYNTSFPLLGYTKKQRKTAECLPGAVRERPLSGAARKVCNSLLITQAKICSDDNVWFSNMGLLFVIAAS